MKTVKEALKTLYPEILESYHKENEFKLLRNCKTFYEFMESQLEKYLLLCREINEEEIVELLEDQGELHLFKGEYTKERFLNLQKAIVDTVLNILQVAYKGDFYAACTELNSLMKGQKKINRYLVEGVQDYLQVINLSKDSIFYRMRNKEKNTGAPDDCSHVPFVLRSKASFQRYNMSGIPCLYLADSKETADNEIGQLGNNKDRWCGEFKSRRSVGVLDLTIPTQECIEKEKHLNTLLGWLLTYPLRLSCAIKVENKGNFCEEYIFPQLMFHWMYMIPENKRSSGFMYSSTKNPGGVNYVFPARYDGKTPPTHKDKQISTELEKLFKASEPKLYKKGKEKKKYSIEIAEI